MKKYDTVLFDYDGTIADTNQLVIDSWQHTYMARWGHPEEEAKIIESFGEPLTVTMGKVLPEWDVEESIEIYRSFQRDIYKDRIKIFPGMAELIEKLADLGYKLGVVTSRLRSSTYEGLEKFGIDGYMNAVVTCEDTDKHKPDPEPALICLRELGANPDRAIMVGDSFLDIGCAHNAGVKAVFVNWAITGGAGDLAGEAGAKADVTLFTPDYRIDRPEELLGILGEG